MRKKDPKKSTPIIGRSLPGRVLCQKWHSSPGAGAIFANSKGGKKRPQNSIYLKNVAAKGAPGSSLGGPWVPLGALGSPKRHPTTFLSYAPNSGQATNAERRPYTPKGGAMPRGTNYVPRTSRQKQRQPQTTVCTQAGAVTKCPRMPTPGHGLRRLTHLNAGLRRVAGPQHLRTSVPPSLAAAGASFE